MLHEHRLNFCKLMMLECNSGKLKHKSEEVGKGISEREVQGVRLVPVLWH